MQTDEPGSLETADRLAAQSIERCDHCGKPTAEGDARTKSLLDGGVFYSPKCAMRGADV